MNDGYSFDFSITCSELFRVLGVKSDKSLVIAVIT